jgi:hypothetical protein
MADDERMTLVPLVLALGTSLAVYANRGQAPKPVRIPVERPRKG